MEERSELLCCEDEMAFDLAFLEIDDPTDFPEAVDMSLAHLEMRWLRCEGECELVTVGRFVDETTEIMEPPRRGELSCN